MPGLRGNAVGDDKRDAGGLSEDVQAYGRLGRQGVGVYAIFCRCMPGGSEICTEIASIAPGIFVLRRDAYEQNGAVYYPDMVKVKVCETKGKVVGFDAVAFLKNHRTRAELNAQVSIGEAQEKLNPNLRVDASRLTVIPVDGKETAAYEFVCDYQGDTYFIYVILLYL